MKTRRLLLPLLALGTLVGTASAQEQRIGPDFACPRPFPADGLAQAICDNTEMSREEISFEQPYYALRQVRGKDGWQALKMLSVSLSTQLRATCGMPPAGATDQTMPSNTAACYIAETEKQRLFLLGQLEGAAHEEAARPVEQHVALQHRLVDLGYLSADNKADGVYGESTRAAIETWQRVTHRPETSGFLSDADATSLDQTGEHDPIGKPPVLNVIPAAPIPPVAQVASSTQAAAKDQAPAATMPSAVPVAQTPAVPVEVVPSTPDLSPPRGDISDSDKRVLVETGNVAIECFDRNFSVIPDSNSLAEATDTLNQQCLVDTVRLDQVCDEVMVNKPGPCAIISKTIAAVYIASRRKGGLPLDFPSLALMTTKVMAAAIENGVIH